MPEFVPQHTPNGLDDFTKGYLEAAEWLLDEDVNRDKIRGFSRAAIKQAKQDCQDFRKKCAYLLIRYEQVTGRDMRSAGHDFWLTRNHHGAGFWDRGNDPCLKELTEASHAYGGTDPEVWRGWINLR